MKKKIWIAVSIVVVILIIVGVIICTSAVKEKPNDDANKKIMRFENLMGQQYAEILPVYGNGITKDLVAGVYNSIGLNTSDGMGNTAPDEILAKMDLDKLKKEFDALKVLKNAPRFWTIDWVEVDAGKIRDFDGLKARWVMWFPIPKDFKQGESAYKLMEALRNTHMGIKAGSPAFILDDPEGTSWVMKSADRIFHPDQKLEDLQYLGSSLKLPTGWKFRYIILEKELIFSPENGKAWITQDDIGNTYDRTGGAFSNYKP